ncbi:hypothetical protein [Paraliomyxa miuraensis]|uniref:hypothetical protein n=1 Tax=Paraliomyxa miuraensis TaxID=376150 RepID=UPI00225B8BDD|nr:hypothetical protein [Paraliomyxa miuraensis]MCX4247653.1 hypothetical protein [Paraliomyxa miuraensis]
MNAPPRPVRVSTGNPISAIFSSFGRDIADLFRNPLAFLGGLGGMALTSLLLYFGFGVMAKASLDADDEDEFLIDFEPGALVKLGVEMEEPDIPEKIIVQETRQEEETVNETVTEDEQAKPVETPPPEPEEKPKKTDKPPPIEKKDKKLPVSKLPTTANTPYKNDLPTVQQQKGDPFGDPGGWSDLKKDGDPWATAVMKALNNMKVGAYAAKAGAGNFKFQLTICKDGTVKKVDKKGGTLDADGQNAVRLALEQLDIPKPPAEVAKKMTSSCAKIKYTFNWSAGSVK